MGISTQSILPTIFVIGGPDTARAEGKCVRELVLPKLQERLGIPSQAINVVYLQGSEDPDQSRGVSSAFLASLYGLLYLRRYEPAIIVFLRGQLGRVLSQEELSQLAIHSGVRFGTGEWTTASLLVQHAVLSNQAALARSFFYVDENESTAQGPLSELIGEVTKTAPNQVRSYNLSSDASDPNQLEQLARLVLEDLARCLAQPAATHVDGNEAHWGKQSTTMLFSPTPVRTQPIGQALEFALAEPSAQEPYGLCIVGPPGSGKTTLASQVYHALQGTDVLCLLYSCGEERPSRLDDLLLQWSRQLARILNRPLPDTVPDQLPESFWQLVRSIAANGRRLVLVLDGADELEPTEVVHTFAWLPEEVPAGVKLLVTTASGPVSDYLESVPGFRTVTISGLQPAEIQVLLQSVWEKHGRKLPQQVAEQLLSLRLPHGPIAASHPLWAVTAAEALNTGLFSLARGDSAAHGTDLVSLQAAVAKMLPGELDALVQLILESAERRFGVGWTRASASLLAVSRFGLREKDLAVLVPKLAKLVAPTEKRRQWNELSMPELELALGSLLCRRDDGRWDFRHNHIKQVVKWHCLRDQQLLRQVHTLLSYHLKSLPQDDPLRCSELMYHLAESDDRQRAAAYLSGELSECEEHGAMEALATQLLWGEADQPNPAVRWQLSLLLEPKLQPEQILLICRRICHGLLPRVKHSLRRETHERLIRGLEQTLAELVNRYPQMESARRQLDEIRSLLQS